MISSSGESRSTTTSYRSRRRSTPASAICSRTRTLIPAPSSRRRSCGGDGALERLEGPGDRDAALDLRTELGERQLDRGKRARDVEHVEPADVPDAKDLPLQVRLTRRERHAVTVAQVQQELVCVDAIRRAHGGDDGCRVVVGREELEPHRLDPGPGGAAEPYVPLERCLEAVLEQQAERDLEAADDRDRGRE